MNAVAGKAPEEIQRWVRFEDIAHGGWDPAARLEEMDTDGVDAEVLYPTPRLARASHANPDPELHLALVRAYNDWLSEYCSHDPSRLLGLAMIPNRGGVEAAVGGARSGARPSRACAAD